MKKLIFILSITLSLNLLADSVKFKYSLNDTRKFPTNQDYILSYANILESVRSSVVNISTTKNIANAINREFFLHQRNIPQDRIQRALGSGVIISEDGYIVTNNHVVDGADKIIVNLAGDKKKYTAKLIGRDKKSDLAIIKIEKDNLNAVTFYNSDKVRVGDVVFALGNPFGLHETITQGIVSAIGRTSVGIVEYENFIQTDASINPGNSGGALINSAGNLIGINSAILSKSGGNVGIGFAIPSNMVTTIAAQLIENGKYTRAYLGVAISDVSESMSNFYNNSYGALITGIEKDTPAERAGLKRGDLIVAINNTQIKSASELKNKVGSFPPNTQVIIKYLRDKQLMSRTVMLSSLSGVSPNGTVSYSGVVVQNIDASLRSQLRISPNIEGVLVSKIESSSLGAELGILKGDIIIQVENKEIKNLNEFKRAVRSKTKKRIYIYRRGGVFAVVL